MRKKSTKPPARRKPEHGTTREQRIMYVARKITALRWTHGSCTHYANKWGLTRETVSGIVAEAREHLRRTVGDPEHVYVEVLQGLRKLFGDAVRDGDRRHAIDAGRELAKLAGAGAANTVDVKLSALSDGEIAERLREAVEKAQRELEEPDDKVAGA